MIWRLVVVFSTAFLLIHSACRASTRQHPPPPPPPVVQDSGATPDADSSAAVPSEHSVSQPQSSISMWAGGSVHPGGVLGRIPEGWIGLVGIRYHRLLIPTPRHNRSSHDAPTLTYTADAIPLAAVSIPKGTSPGTLSPRIRSVRETGLSTRGVGVYPFGLRVGFRPLSPLRPFIAGHSGLLYLFDPMPDERGRQTNFVAGVGGGVRIPLSRGITLTLGYRYHHLSNGFRGSINPGLDANILYVGLGRAP